MFIPAAANDPTFKSIKDTLDVRNVRSIVVVPIQWQGTVIGAIFLRTDRDAEPFSDADVRFGDDRSREEPARFADVGMFGETIGCA